MGNWPSADVTLKDLYAGRLTYIYPSFQREPSWSLTQQKKLIDSILRELYVPPILAQRVETIDGLMKSLLDGRNRLETVFNYMDGNFPTLSTSLKERGEMKSPSIEPKRHYWELAPSIRARFDMYTFQFIFLDELKKDNALLQYRALQKGSQLAPAEILWSYQGRAAEVGNALEKHSLWETFYRGSSKRKRPFVMCLYLIYLQLFQGIVNMTSPRLTDLSAGQKDTQLTNDLQLTIARNLDYISHLFSGITIHRPEEVIPAYQLVLFLDEKYDFSQSEKGCLSAWFGGIQKSADKSGVQGIADVFGQLVYAGQQKDFWEKELPKVEKAEGLSKKKKKAPLPIPVNS